MRGFLQSLDDFRMEHGRRATQAERDAIWAGLDLPTAEDFQQWSADSGAAMIEFSKLVSDARECERIVWLKVKVRLFAWFPISAKGH